MIRPGKKRAGTGGCDRQKEVPVQWHRGGSRNKKDHSGSEATLATERRKTRHAEPGAGQEANSRAIRSVG